MFAFRLLGQFGIRRNDQPVELNSRPSQSLLAYLLLNAGVEHRREKLAGIIWPEASEENARTYLRQSLWRIRKVIGDDYLIADRVTVTFSSDAEYWLDVAILENSLDPDWTSSILEEMLDVYKGELLPGFYEDWVVLERERLQTVFEQRIRQLLDRLIEEERWKDVLRWGEHWISLGHTPEPAYRALMTAHAGLGDLAGMANVYHRCVQSLQEELGVEPSEQTRLLFQQLSVGRRPAASELALESKADSMATIDAPSGVDQSFSPPAFLSADRQQVQRQIEPFIGREKELSTLEQYLQPALEGRGNVVFVAGEAGQGKSTLLQEFARRMQIAHPDLIVTTGACPVYTPVCSPYGLFREALEMLTGDVESSLNAGTISREQAIRLWQLLPETIENLLQYGPQLLGSLLASEGLMDRARSASIEPEQMERLAVIAQRSREGLNRVTDQGHLFVACADLLIALSNRRPLLIILDDLHWADTSSIGLLGHLGHRLSDGAVLLLGAYRPEELNQGREDEPHPLAPVLGEYKRRFGQILLDLDELELDDGRSFIDALLDTEANDLDDSFRQAFTRHTNGHPLFSVELLHEMKLRGALVRNNMGRWVIGPGFDWDIIPPRVEGVIETRFSHIDQELRQWLDLASVEGKTFMAEVVAQAMSIEARIVVNRLSKELDRRYHLVTAQGIRQVGTKRLSRYQFRHNLFQQHLYSQLDEIERSYLHQQVGETLERLFEGRTVEIADQLANHFQKAGLAEKTMIYLIKAGDNAARAYAYDEAKSYYEQASMLIREFNEDGSYDRTLADLYIKLGRTLEHKADVKGAMSIYREMESYGRSRANQPMLLKARVAQGTMLSVSSPVHDPKMGREISEQALVLARELNDRPAEAKILWNLMHAYGYESQLEQAIKYGERALDLVRDLNDNRQLGLTLSDLSGWYWVAGEIDKAKELSGEAAVIWRESDNLPMLADILSQSSYTSMSAGDYDEAIALSEESWQISQSINNQWNLAFSRSRIGFIHRARGELGLSISESEESVRIGEVLDLPNPQIFAGAEVAFSYAYLGATRLGLKTIRNALNVAEKKGPSYRPYLLAALAQNHLVNADIEQAEAAIQEARTDPRWQAFPVLCLAPILVDGQLAMARADYGQALYLGEELLDYLRRHGIRSYLPGALDLVGQALFNQGRLEEARIQMLEAREEAEAMGAKGNLWPILFHLSQLEKEPSKAWELCQEAREIIDFIADNTGSSSLRESFLALPEVQAVIEASN